MKTPIPPATIGRLFLQTVQSIVLVRHAKAPKINQTDMDDDRVVNQLGHDQAKKLGLKMQTYDFDVMLSSPLQRVKQTLSIATNGRNPIIEVPELTCAVGDGNPIDVMFNELGYVPMSKYLEHSLGDHLKVWGRTALEAVVSKLEVRSCQQVLVGGHAVLQNALTWAIAEALEKNCDWVNGFHRAQNMALDETLNDGEGFILHIKQRPAGAFHVTAEHITLD